MSSEINLHEESNIESSPIPFALYTAVYCRWKWAKEPCSSARMAAEKELFFISLVCKDPMGYRTGFPLHLKAIVS